MTELKKKKEPKLNQKSLMNIIKNKANSNNSIDIDTIEEIFNDLDYFSSTKNSFQIFDTDIENFLPRVFCYFDDVIGSAEEMYSEYSGELLAIKDFNDNNENRKISLNKNLQHLDTIWKNQIYYLHNFDHSKYNNFIDPDEQIGINQSIVLK